MKGCVALLVVALAAGDAPLLAQDRVILLEPSVQNAQPPQLPGSIREIEISDGGRGWSEVVRVELPPHTVFKPPVALADGRTIMWLAIDRNTSVLAQYDRTTYRASVVDVGRFSLQAFLVADRSSPRVFVVDPPARIVAVDERLRPFAVTLPGPMTVQGAVASEEALLLSRTNRTTGESDVVLLDSRSGEIVRTVPLGRGWRVNHMQISRDAQRVYIAYAIGFQQHYLDLYSVTTGELLARAPNANPQVLELDEARGVVISDQPAPFVDTLYSQRAFQVRDARTLALLQEFGLGFFNQLRGLNLATTRDAVVIYHETAVSSLFDHGCRTWAPRVTLFDARTRTAVRQIDLQGHCPFLVQLPAR